MILQNVLWPSADICMQEDMYFRGSAKAIRIGNYFRFEKGGSISTDTYFNGVSINKWKKYTNIDKLRLVIKLQGSFRVSLAYKQKVHKKIHEKVVREAYIQNQNQEEITLDFPEGEGMAFFNVEALENGGKFLGGRYDIDVSEKQIRDVKIGIGICTYRRESYIEHNLEVLKKYILENPNSELSERLEVFISDNGQTLNIEKLNGQSIHIVKNKNAGGAAGFARDMIEVLDANRRGAGITHLLLMDDDVTIDPEAILKTYRILAYLKEEYADAFIGGAMLRSDARSIQVEAGASWNAGKLISLKKNLDMKSCDACLYNETEEYAEFNAWWYCCFPISVVSEKNLPIPIFFRGDDVEYGLRNMKHLILMNGICVWHEPFEYKYSSVLSYYLLRNQFIDNALHFPNYKRKRAMQEVRDRIIREILYYRYKNADLIIRGVQDFLKGIDWLKKTDGEVLHKEILAVGYKTLPIEQLAVPFSYPVYENSLTENDTRFRRILRLACGNGYILHAKRDNVVSMSSIRPYNAYRARRLLNYDVITGKGFITEKNSKKAIQCLISMAKLIKDMNQNYDKVAREYRKRCGEIQNIQFWKKYLEI